MFRTAPVVEPAPDVMVPPEPPVPLSHLELDLPAPVAGWPAFLAARGVEVTLDDIGRMSISRDDARQRRAQIWGGIPADLIPVGVSAAQAMVAAEKDARPRRRSVLEDSLSNSGTVYHPIRSDGE